MNIDQIISLLPYKKPFLFVDQIEQIDDNGIRGNYTFRQEEFYYAGHFPDKPITPGVILTEVMAQIGLVAFGIFLMREKEESDQAIQFALVENHINFFIPVLPSTKVIVHSEKVYFRFGKLKCNVIMKNEAGDVICKGFISGMMFNKVTY